MKIKTKKIMKRKIALLLLSIFMFSAASAQCTFKNTAFKGGEFLSYNLYYNWKFVWVKAGTASMYTVQSNYKGKPAYRASLTTRGNNKVDEMFVLRDTLLCYSSLDMAPLYFRKGAREGERYTVDEVWYSYPNGKSHVNTTSSHMSRKLGSLIYRFQLYRFLRWNCRRFLFLFV